MSDIFKEIDEELRRENFAKLWKRYGIYVIGFVGLVIVATGLFVGWRQYDARLRAEEGERYQFALDLLHRDKLKEANAAFAPLAQDSGRRAVLARFEEAAILERNGDLSGATARYEAIAGDASVDSVFRDLATILAAQDGLAHGDTGQIVARLRPLTTADGPWQPSAARIDRAGSAQDGRQESGTRQLSASGRRSDSAPGHAHPRRRNGGGAGAMNIGSMMP